MKSKITHYLCNLFIRFPHSYPNKFPLSLKNLKTTLLSFPSFNYEGMSAQFPGDTFLINRDFVFPVPVFSVALTKIAYLGFLLHFLCARLLWRQNKMQRKETERERERYAVTLELSKMQTLWFIHSKTLLRRIHFVISAGGIKQQTLPK